VVGKGDEAREDRTEALLTRLDALLDRMTEVADRLVARLDEGGGADDERERGTERGT
jgi:hypothetical protein